MGIEVYKGILGYRILAYFLRDIGLLGFFFFFFFFFFFLIWDIQEFWDMGYWNLSWDTS